MKHYMKTILYGLLAVSLSLLPAGCEKNNRPDIPDGEEGTGTDDSWVLVWSDEFDAPTPDGRPNPLNWSYDLGNSGFGNAELQNYTDRVENASYVTLVLVALESLPCETTTTVSNTLRPESTQPANMSSVTAVSRPA